MMSSIIEIFCEEATEHLTALERGFLDLEQVEDLEARRDVIDHVFRHAHTLKGDARAVGALMLQEASQTLEDHLDELREDPELVTSDSINQGLTLFDAVRSSYEIWREWGDSPPPESPEPVEEAKPAENVEPVEPPKEAATPKPARVDPPAPAVAEENHVIRVHSEKLDRLLSTAGELRTAQLGQSQVAGDLSDLGDCLAQLLSSARGQIHRSQESAPCSDEMRCQLEDSVEKIQGVERSLRKQHVRSSILLRGLEREIQEVRLLPLASLLEEYRRPLREIAQSLEKKLIYDVEVGSIQLDKAVLEALRGPLMHLLRNAVDHGLELPAEREALGKAEQGTIRVEACRRKNRVEIVVSDDGRGIQYDRIREELHRKGAGEEDIANRSLQELREHLFEPGMSTQSVPTLLSGRGVGLDAVQHSIRLFRGTIRIEDGPTGGTVLRLAVPVTISTIRILTVVDGGRHYAVPTSDILHIGQARLSELGELAGAPTLKTADGPIRFVRLASLLGRHSNQDSTQANSMPYLLMEQEGRRFAVSVEECEDEMEVLVKPLGYPLDEMPGIPGAIVRADGSIQLVLDLCHPVYHQKLDHHIESLPAPEQREVPLILLADDSPTTRAIMQNVFLNAGFRVLTARDGQEAVDRFRSEEIDLVVSDVEMPRMDGFELTRELKRLSRTPVILVTGLEKETYRRRGLEAGADAYLVKSTFQGDGLLDIVYQFVGKPGDTP